MEREGFGEERSVWKRRERGVGGEEGGGYGRRVFVERDCLWEMVCLREGGYRGEEEGEGGMEGGCGRCLERGRGGGIGGDEERRG